MLSDRLHVTVASRVPDGKIGGKKYLIFDISGLYQQRVRRKEWKPGGMFQNMKRFHRMFHYPFHFEYSP